MDNWMQNKDLIISKTISDIMENLRWMTKNPSEMKSTNYWFDSAHNIFVFTNYNDDDDSWFEIHFELYDRDEELIGDLVVLNSEDTTEESLEKEIRDIVKLYYNE